jgi:hypothetical protein
MFFAGRGGAQRRGWVLRQGKAIRGTWRIALAAAPAGLDFLSKTCKNYSIDLEIELQG